jgi:hypothetical protein
VEVMAVMEEEIEMGKLLNNDIVNLFKKWII